MNEYFRSSVKIQLGNMRCNIWLQFLNSVYMGNYYKVSEEENKKWEKHHKLSSCINFIIFLLGYSSGSFRGTLSKWIWICTLSHTHTQMEIIYIFCAFWIPSSFLLFYSLHFYWRWSYGRTFFSDTHIASLCILKCLYCVIIINARDENKGKRKEGVTF